MQVVTYREDAVPVSLRLQVVSLQDAAWPSGRPLDPAPWHDPRLSPRSVLLIDGEARVVAALDILSKELVHGGMRFAASGISAMVTDPVLRGRGLGRRLAAAARDLMAADGADLGIFTCDRELQPFYEAAGWTCLEGSVLIGGSPEAPFASDQFDKVTMAAFLTERAVSAAPGFVGVRIELYPGEIDRLW